MIFPFYITENEWDSSKLNWLNRNRHKYCYSVKISFRSYVYTIRRLAATKFAASSRYSRYVFIVSTIIAPPNDKA